MWHDAAIGASHRAARGPIRRVAVAATLLGTALPATARAQLPPAVMAADVTTQAQHLPPDSEAAAPLLGAATGARRGSSGSRLTVEAVAGVVGSVGVAPAPAVGATLGAGLRWREISIGLEGRFDAAASKPVQGGGRASSSLAVLTLAPCGTMGLFLGCALLQGGQMHATGEGATVTEGFAPWWAAGVRIGLLVPLGGDRTSFRLRSDVLVDLVPPLVELNGVPAWNAPRVAESLGADIVVHFR